MPKTTNHLITDFLEYLEIEKGKSPLTIKNYDFYLRRFFTFCKISKPDAVTLEEVKNFRLYLNRLRSQSGELMKKSTQNYHLIALRAFLKYLAKHDIKTLAPEKIELAKTPERQVSFLEGSDLERLLEAPLHTKEPGIIQKRDKAILEMLFSTGLRVSELASLHKDQINLHKDEFTVRGKGDKLRIVFLSNQAKYWLKQYLDKRNDNIPALFIRHDRARKKQLDEIDPKDYKLTPRTIQRIVHKYSKSAGLTKKVTPHTMRHSYATDLLMGGADIRSVQSMLGHSSITTTQIYTHITDQQLKDVYKAFHGKARKKN